MEVGLFRYALIPEALNEELTTKQRGRLVRAAAAPDRIRGRSGHRCGCRGPPWTGGSGTTAPAGSPRWCPPPRRLVGRAPARSAGVGGGVEDRGTGPHGRAGRGDPGRAWRGRPVGADVAAALRRGRLTRPVPTGRRWRCSAGSRRDARTCGGSAMRCTAHTIAGRKAILIAFLDDHSRAVVAARWGYAENAVALRETLSSGSAARGCPGQCLCRQRVGVHRQRAAPGLRRAGHPAGHSRPGRRRQGQDRTVLPDRPRSVPRRDQRRTPTTTGSAGTDVAAWRSSTRLFTAWVEQVYHQRVHTETEQTPLARFLAAGPPRSRRPPTLLGRGVPLG